MVNTTMIEINGVSKKFRIHGKEFHALRDVSLGIKKGEIFALLGPNGSGKTTLINIIIGLIIPDKGTVKLAGKDASKFPDVAEKIGLVSTEARFHWALSVKDVLTFFGVVYGINKTGRDKRIAELVEFFGLQKVANRRIDGLSTGERMRLSFAKALLNKPKILLLDEPTLGLDPYISEKIRKEIKNINKAFGATILLTSHYMKEVRELSDRVAFISKGEILDIRDAKGLDMEKYFINMTAKGDRRETE